MKQITGKWRNQEYLASIIDSIDSITAGRPIISDADLSGITIGPFAVLEQLKTANLFESRISDTDLSYSKLSGSANNSFFMRVSLENASLNRVILCRSEIINCSFSRSKLVINMDDTICEKTAFVKARFAGGSYGMEYGGRRVKFIDCDFTDAVFDRVEFRASTFINCIFADAKFRKCDFRGARFEAGVLPLATQFENMDIPAQCL
ncbi:pentapeptide repeat-containing protein [Xanthomonas rydalmerensis]|uniref:Pentapeptide repeat-containing protein n=1 Tax=Xanthomonas rydalmerensis TaxID=3046274 RepID=A0ABZ0JLX2_9XANT|nr:pentapeptide repeat-containing protein [Xanthomonas sp. DM-2023]WOS40426.1 pentapeptide repeat-containing protein [Xanthomonas sp. DM-2023]WOS44610.1 pentapeptide repeat-containing protein [Xanthomonas sp. DM-2023]WOS48790.1 pentapeptide repeat-containing protein [Xanthomonas sp. DM-2023]WOS52970.1 pentapeptide repeat-containing protein [Xanthomonas sp. DM-2023]WOS57154.1 pentapeptide repeat-containing protein [Xanthomonas sp. DM-2023]